MLLPVLFFLETEEHVRGRKDTSILSDLSTFLSGLRICRAW
jgi:hypothetical protein